MSFRRLMIFLRRTKNLALHLNLQWKLWWVVSTIFWNSEFLLCNCPLVARLLQFFIHIWSGPLLQMLHIQDFIETPLHTFLCPFSKTALLLFYCLSTCHYKLYIDNRCFIHAPLLACLKCLKSIPYFDTYFCKYPNIIHIYPIHFYPLISFVLKFHCPYQFRAYNYIDPNQRHSWFCHSDIPETFTVRLFIQWLIMFELFSRSL